MLLIYNVAMGRVCSGFLFLFASVMLTGLLDRLMAVFLFVPVVERGPTITRVSDIVAQTSSTTWAGTN
jgi:hypothetical protein